MKLFTPYNIGPVELRNRTIRSAAFEGMCENNGPTQRLHDYHVSVAKGGVGMTTLAYASICESGLSFKSQLLMKSKVLHIRHIESRLYHTRNRVLSHLLLPEKSTSLHSDVVLLSLRYKR